MVFRKFHISFFVIADRNFHFGKDAKAYTEDEVLVSNLYIYNVPSDASRKDVRKYFRKFGKIKVQLLAEQQAGIVSFSDPLAAAEALRKKEHRLVGERVNVKACDSWDQPAVATEMTANVDDKTTQTTSLVCLNDDCLLCICRKLELRDKICFAMAHSRFAAVIAMYSRQEHKVFHLEKVNKLTLWQQRELFRLFGPNMETVRGFGPCRNPENVVDFMCDWSVNVNALNLEWRQMFDTTLSRLLQHMQQITKLCLRSCSLDDENILAIRNLPNLRILSLPQNYNLTGKYLNQLATVQHLNLYDCFNLQTAFIRGTLKTLTSIESLNVQHCHGITTGVFEDVNGGCSMLKSLKISLSEIDEYDCAMHLSGLKHLEIAFMSYTRPDSELFFKPLSLQKLQQLEYLHIAGMNLIGRTQAQILATLTQLRHLMCPNNKDLDDMCLREFAKLKHLQELDISNCVAITNKGLIHLLGKCRKLKKLNLASCGALTQHMTHQLIAVLKETQAKRDAPMEISVVKTDIPNGIIEQDAKYREALTMKLLKLNFENCPVYLRRIKLLIKDDDNAEWEN